jgi:VanZ family protein
LSFPSERNAGFRRIDRTLLLWLALGYLLFAIYGSLVPLEFRDRPLADAWAAFREIYSMSLSFGSRTDWLVNILLFIPLAFLLADASWPAHSLAARALAVLGVFVVCLGLSVTIEFMQLFFPNRTPSLNDIVAQSIGAGLGLAAWVTFGSRLSDWFIGWGSARSPLDVWKRMVYTYLFVLVAYNILPLDLTISPIEIVHKWREGRVVLLPFSFAFINPIEEIYALGVDVLIWIPASFLWCLAFPRGRLRAWLALVGIATGIEFLQLFVYSRVSDMTDIFAAAMGAAIGTWLAGRMGRAGVGTTVIRETTFSQLRSAGVWLLLTMLWMVVLAAVFFYPFDFQMDSEFLAKRWHGAGKVPFEVYYFGTEYRAATEVVHKTGFFLPLGALLALAVRTIQNYRWRQYASAIALAMIGVTAAGIELGQLFVPEKNVDVTDWALEVLGGVIGFAMIRYLNRRLQASGKMEVSHERPDEMDVVDVGGTMGSISPEIRGGRVLGLIAAGLVLWVMIAWLAMRSSLTPYNVRELMDDRYPLLSLVLLAGCFYWTTGFPVLIVQRMARGQLYLLSLPPLALAHGLIAWVLLRFAVPMESIYDIVGAPVLAWPWEWEIFGRFLALFSFWSVAASAAVIVAAWRFLPGVKSALLGWLVGACLFIPMSYYIVVPAAATDNLVELMADNGGVGAFLLIGLAMAWMAFGGMNGALALIPNATKWATAVAWMLGSGVLAYLALYFGTEQMIVKYDRVFSALQFLLSSNRSTLAEPGELMVRYAALYVFFIAAMIMVQYPLWRWIMTISPRSARTAGHVAPRWTAAD